jgi:hypothetical protein
VVDTWRSHAPGPEDSAETVKAAKRGAFDNWRKAAPGAQILVLAHLNKGGDLNGTRALKTTFDLVLKGTDTDERIWYSVEKPRTLRQGDLILQKFTIDRDDEHDDDDTRATTSFRHVLKSEPKAARSEDELSHYAKKALKFCQERPDQWLAVKAIRVGVGNPPLDKLKSSLGELTRLHLLDTDGAKFRHNSNRKDRQEAF